MVRNRSQDWDAIVLAGGRSSRLDGVDKTALRYGDRTLLDHALTAVLDARTIAVVGPRELESRLGPAQWHSHVVIATERPRFGGPASAVASGLEALSSAPAEWTAVVAADQPSARNALAVLLTERRWHPLADALLAHDNGDRLQPLLAIYRTSALRNAIAAHGSVDGVSMRALTSELWVAAIPLGDVLCVDIDTPEDAGVTASTCPSAWAARVADDVDAIEEWLLRLAEALGIPAATIDRTLLLDLARDAAHGVARPAAPLTTFLVGLAAGRSGGSSADIRQATNIATAALGVP